MKDAQLGRRGKNRNDPPGPEQWTSLSLKAAIALLTYQRRARTTGSDARAFVGRPDRTEVHLQLTLLGASFL